MFVITEDWFFESHFLDRAFAAADSGHEIFVATKITNRSKVFLQNRITVIPISFHRSSINPFQNLLTLFEIISIYRCIAPDIIHQIALKPIIYGTIARFITNLKAKIINAPVGMGYVFTSLDTKATLLKPLVHCLLRVTLNPQNSKVIFENPDDLLQAIKKKFTTKEDAVLIRGAGVDTDLFMPRVIKNKIPVVTLVARMLVDKGINEFIEASKIINKSGVVAIFNLVGDPDFSNPATLDSAYLDAVSGCHGLYWRGHSNDIAEIYQETDIACLPSYREGLPKSLIEAAACGLPIVTTDAVGCREVVLHKINGFLVPIKSSSELAAAILCLLNDHDLRVKMGNQSRRFALEKFSSKIVIKKTLELY